MSDLINGREMLKRYQVDLCYDIACKDCSMSTEEGGCRVEKWIDTFPSADRPQGEWIPCSERHPKENGEYMITLDFEWGREIEIGLYADGEWLNDNRHANIAWRPLIEPWKGADDE